MLDAYIIEQRRKQEQSRRAPVQIQIPLAPQWWIDQEDRRHDYEETQRIKKPAVTEVDYTIQM